MGVSCAVFNLPVFASGDYAVLDSSCVDEALLGCEDFSFRETLDPTAVPGFEACDFYPDDSKELVATSDECLGFSGCGDESLASVAAPGLEAPFKEPVLQPAFGLGAPDQVIPPPEMVTFDQWSTNHQRLAGWIDATSASANVEWQGNVKQEQCWFNCPQLDAFQQVQQQLSLVPPSAMDLEPPVFTRHCPDPGLENYLIGNSGGSSTFLPCREEQHLGVVVGFREPKREILPEESQGGCPNFGGGDPRLVFGSENSSRLYGGSPRPSEEPVPFSSKRKCRMARKRRTPPYHMPFPCCTFSTKPVEEVIAEKNLKFLLQKELKPSDVGNLGRIVLPKKEAESMLPPLNVREGMTILMEDLTMSYTWNMRYRFWPNNKSRMYLLENTGEFIRSHCLKEGDLLRLYKDPSTGKYAILGKKASAVTDEDGGSSNSSAASRVVKPWKKLSKRSSKFERRSSRVSPATDDDSSSDS